MLDSDRKKNINSSPSQHLHLLCKDSDSFIFNNFTHIRNCLQTTGKFIVPPTLSKSYRDIRIDLNSQDKKGASIPFDLCVLDQQFILPA